MRSFKQAVCLLFGAALSVRALSTPLSARTLGVDIDGVTIDPSSVPTTTTGGVNSNIVPPLPSVTPQTNAKRMAQGLPPLPPTKRSAARRSQPSNSPSQTASGVIQVRQVSDNSIVGYVALNEGNNNHYGIHTDPTYGITFSLPYDPSATTSGPLDISATNADNSADYPFMAGIVGVVNDSDDLSTGSSNFCYIQGSTQTPVGSSPAAVPNSYPSTEDAESAIWSYTPATGAITPQWINTDSSAPATSIEYVSGSNALVMVADSATFEQNFPASELVEFILVAASSAPDVTPPA